MALQASYGSWTATLPDLSEFDQDVFLQYLALERLYEHWDTQLSAYSGEQPSAEKHDKMRCLRLLLDAAWTQALAELPEVEWTEE